MGYHSSSPFFKNSDILNEMMRTIAQITGAVKYAHGEVGYIASIRSDIPEIKGKTAEQMEIEFLPRPIEEMGDFLVLSRWIIRNIAYKYDAVATFTPKLEEGIAGNGLHFHLAVMKDGKNVMLDSSGSLSTEAKKLIAGLCYYADSLTAFGNTVSSAYLRLVPNQEAPTKICWSDLNRSAMIRVPLGWNSITHLSSKINPQDRDELRDRFVRQTVELRSPDGSALIHLLLAGISLAAEYGFTMDDALDFAEKFYVTGNIFKDRKILRKLPSLPGSCVESARILKKKRHLYEREGIFKPEVIDYIIRMLEKENDEHMNERLVDLPADDRLHETRKIMHKDLHKH
jgi:glutamine synthetase